MCFKIVKICPNGKLLFPVVQCLIDLILPLWKVLQCQLLSQFASLHNFVYFRHKAYFVLIIYRCLCDVTCCIFCIYGCRYLCDFIYYTSLHINCECSAFVHVPPLGKPYSGQQLALSIRHAILAMLSQLTPDQVECCS